MCGFCGFFSKEKFEAEHVCQKMADRLAHRGPDSSGVWYDESAGLVLGHRRLSIQDLSALGNQPMVSPSGRYVVAFNGEIYNFIEIQKNLIEQGCKFKGNSDTEVLLIAFEVWGVRKALESFTGMFAFSLWDRKKQILTLARDRIGEKPLYYGWQGKTFLFGSELKSLKAHPAWNGKINRNSLALYMRHNYIPAPYSIYENIFKLMPGTFLQLSAKSSPGEPTNSEAYWDAKQIVLSRKENRFTGNDFQAVEELDSLLRETIRNKMISDVSLGAFLSGGIDSSTIVAMMQAESSTPVKTFSIGLHEAGYNEAEYAKKVAGYLGTEHTELYVSSKKAMDVIPALPLIYDEPFSDSSQIPTFLVSQMTKQYVTVSLSGDGGDELFGGYNRYFQGQAVEKTLAMVPVPLRKYFASVLCLPSPMSWDRFFSLLPVCPQEFRQRPGDKIHKLAEVLMAHSPMELYRTLVSHWKNPCDVVLNSVEPDTFLNDTSQKNISSDFTEQMMYWDMISYLPDDILCKVDRAAMAVSLETRVPFLDHKIVEFAWSLPLSMKIKNGKGKWVLRQVLGRYVPAHIMDRPKMGFGIPIDSWLRGPLREWAEDLLDKGGLKADGFFQADLIDEKWTEHLSGRRNWQYYLWDVLMFQAWLSENR